MNFHSPSEPNDEESEDVFETARRRMAPKHRLAADILDAVNNVYVSSGRDRTFQARFDRFLTFVTARQRHGRRGKGNAFFITGLSGAGKSDMVENVLMTHPVMQPIQVNGQRRRPWTTVSLQGPATLRVLGAQILGSLGYQVKPTTQRAEIWRILPEKLQFNKVFLVHIDETQHLLTKGADTVEVASAIKGLMNYRPFPISFILSGMPQLNDLIVHDDQAERREFSLALPSVHPNPDGQLIEDIINALCTPAGIDCVDLLASDMPERIAHAADYQFGRICEVVVHGIHHAVLKEAKTLERDHFARAYRDHSNTNGLDDMNPFTVEDWETLAPGYFVVKKGEDL